MGQAAPSQDAHEQSKLTHELTGSTFALVGEDVLAFAFSSVEMKLCGIQPILVVNGCRAAAQPVAVSTRTISSTSPLTKGSWSASAGWKLCRALAINLTEGRRSPGFGALELTWRVLALRRRLGLVAGDIERSCQRKRGKRPHPQDMQTWCVDRDCGTRSKGIWVHKGPESMLIAAKLAGADIKSRTEAIRPSPATHERLNVTRPVVTGAKRVWKHIYSRTDYKP